MTVEKDKTWRLRLHEIIYESNTFAGKAFDVSLLVLIIASIIIVMLDSVQRWHNLYGAQFSQAEWLFTFVFTLEYILRLISIEKPLRYVFSFLGIVDLLAIIPSYLSILSPGAESLLVFRGLRLLRVFRIFKLTHFLSEMQFLGTAIRGSMTKISIFMMVVFTLVIICGSLMYLIEGGQNGFSSIPDSIYWAIVTITTVGYGDISPVTPSGKFVASIIMLMGYGIIAVPTGILTNEIALQARRKEQKQEVCPGCGKEGHDLDAKHCKNCGALL